MEVQLVEAQILLVGLGAELPSKGPTCPTFHASSCWVLKLCSDALVRGEVPVPLGVLGGGLIPSVHPHRS